MSRRRFLLLIAERLLVGPSRTRPKPTLAGTGDSGRGARIYFAVCLRGSAPAIAARDSFEAGGSYWFVPSAWLSAREHGRLHVRCLCQARCRRVEDQPRLHSPCSFHPRHHGGNWSARRRFAGGSLRRARRDRRLAGGSFGVSCGAVSRSSNAVAFLRC